MNDKREPYVFPAIPKIKPISLASLRTNEEVEKADEGFRIDHRLSMEEKE